MQTKIVSINPTKAKEWLAEMHKRIDAKTHRQQPLKPGKVQRFAVAMMKGKWLRNGEQLKFDDLGNLIDGQHRLHAIILSGVTLEMEVRYGIPHLVNGQKVMDTIDTESRKLGVRLFLSDDIHNFKRAAALSKFLAFIATRKTLPQDISQAREILDLFDLEIADAVEACSQGQKELRSWFLGTIAWAAKVNKQKTLEFANAYVTMHNLPKGHPALMLRVWMSNTVINNGYGGRERQLDAVCAALRLHFEGETTKRIVATRAAHDWLLNQSKTLTRKVIEIATPPEFLKLAA